MLEDPKALAHEAQATTIRMEKAKQIIEVTIPAVAIPVGAPTDESFCWATIPKTKPTIATKTPTYGKTNEQIPSTSEAIAKPYPGGLGGATTIGGGYIGCCG